MKWEGERESDNVEDRRGQPDGGGGGGMRLGSGRGLGLGGVVVALLAAWLFGLDPGNVLQMLDGGVPGTAAPESPAAPRAKPQDSPGRFVSTILASTEDVWRDYFARQQMAYRPPKLVLFSGQTGTTCGQGVAAMGPFYCPGDRSVYIDLGFYATLKERLGAPGDFAQAYVIAHEVGHHLQNLQGITAKLDEARSRVSDRVYRGLSVRLELQADCYAGVWGARAQAAKGWLASGDVEEALNAASRIGDDALQRSAGGPVVPESFTHGSSEQRVRWFRRGLEAGDLSACDTFGSQRL